MFRFKRLILLVVGLALLGVIGCQKKQKSVILDVDGHTVTTETMVKRFKSSRDYKRNAVINPSIIRVFLENNYLNGLLYQAEGYALGLHKEESIVNTLEKQKRSILSSSRSKMMQDLQDVEIEVSETQIKDFYNSMTQKYKAAHIMLRSKKRADSLYNELKQDTTKYEESFRMTTAIYFRND